jgi:trafficking protein particle complex subunit 13
VQVAFLLEEQRKPDIVEEEEKEAVQDIHNVMPGDKIILGQLNIQWTSAMGDRGSLSTGWLVARKR